MADNSSIFLIGGVNKDSNALNSMEVVDVLNVNSNNAEQIMSHERKKPSACIAHQRIFIVSPNTPIIDIYSISDKKMMTYSPTYSISNVCMVTKYKNKLLLLTDKEAFIEDSEINLEESKNVNCEKICDIQTRE